MRKVAKGITKAMEIITMLAIIIFVAVIVLEATEPASEPAPDLRTPKQKSEDKHVEAVNNFHSTMHDAGMPHTHPMPAVRKKPSGGMNYEHR